MYDKIAKWPLWAHLSGGFMGWELTGLLSPVRLKPPTTPSGHYDPVATLVVQARQVQTASQFPVTASPLASDIVLAT